MDKKFLFAIDSNKEEIIVSNSLKGSNEINFIERINRIDNDILYDSISILTKITKTPNFDITVFKAMDKVCQLIYEKHKQIN
ncbi:hypothetical protein [Polaribacter sp.]|uniref:hypothetical protein n=1 Tax=Polaribacter sp. TaxID=1920175 RepID=UPI0040474738